MEDRRKTMASDLTEEQVEQWRRRIRETTRAHYHLCMGLALEDQGDLPAAQTQYSAALEQDPTTAAASVRLEAILNQSGRRQEAETVAAKAAVADPAFRAEADLSIARIRLGLGQIPACEAHLQSFLEHSSTGDATNAKLSKAGDLFRSLYGFYNTHHKVADAQRICALAIKAVPEDASAYAEWGNSLIGELRFTEAWSRFKHSVVYQPDLAEAWYGVGVSGQFTDQVQQANRALSRLLVLAPSAYAYHQLGWTLIALERHEEAVVAMRQAVDLTSASYWSVWGLVWALLCADRLDEAEEVDAKMVKQGLPQGWGSSNRAVIHMRRNRVEEAVSYLQQQKPQSMVALDRVWHDLNRYLILSIAGNADAATAALNDALSSSPEATRGFARLRPWAKVEFARVLGSKEAV